MSVLSILNVWVWLFCGSTEGIWLKTYYYSCKLVAFLLAANEKKGILDFIYLIQSRANRNIAHLCCIWLYCWLPIWGFSMWWCCLYPFFMRPNCKWSALVSGDKLWPIWKERRLGTVLIILLVLTAEICCSLELV